jgi:hypothetical protein
MKRLSSEACRQKCATASRCARTFARPKGGRQVSRAADTHALRQERRARVLPKGRGPRVRGRRTRRPREIYLGGRLVSVQVRISGRLRHSGVGGRAFPIRTERSGCTANPTSARRSSWRPLPHPPHLAGICPNYTPSNYHDGWIYQDGAFEQWFNESWTTILAENTVNRRAESGSDPLRWSQTLPLVVVSRARNALGCRTGAVFHRLARAPRLRRLLEAVVDRRSLLADPSSGIQRGGVVRHFPGRDAKKLWAPQERGQARRPRGVASG